MKEPSYEELVKEMSDQIRSLPNKYRPEYAVFDYRLNEDQIVIIIDKTGFTKSNKKGRKRNFIKRRKKRNLQD